MKPIKFRAWSGMGIRMFMADEFYITLDGKLFDVDPSTGCLERAPDIVLMQFTGLQDRNGVDIFEGDILHLDYARIEGGRLGTVFAVPGGFGWETFEDEVGKEIITSYECMGNRQNAKWIGQSAKVIGNIYENPELLTATKAVGHADQGGLRSAT